MQMLNDAMMMVDDCRPILTSAWLCHSNRVCCGIFPSLQVISAAYQFESSPLSFFSSTFYTLKRHNTLQECREEAGEVEEVREGKLSGGYPHLRSVYYFFTLVVDLF